MLSTKQSESSRVIGPGKCSMTSRSAFKAANGYRSAGRQRRSTRRSVSRRRSPSIAGKSLKVGVGDEAFEAARAAQRLQRLALQLAHHLAVDAQPACDLVQRSL